MQHALHVPKSNELHLPVFTVLVCGGRHYTNRAEVFRWLAWLWRPPSFKIIHGACRTGADAFAQAFADANGIWCEPFPADWDTHGKAAGPLRNARMIEEPPDLVLAFPGGRGTANMVGLAKASRVPVLEVFT